MRKLKIEDGDVKNIDGKAIRCPTLTGMTCTIQCAWFRKWYQGPTNESKLFCSCGNNIIGELLQC